MRRLFCTPAPWSALPSGKRHYRVSLADALSAHKRALTFGGLDGIPNIGMVESAIARPYSGYYRSIERKTSALVHSMATNHGFADGNKRTTVIVMHLLLKKSGFRLVTKPRDGSLDQAVEKMVLAVVEREMTFDDLVDWFRARIRKSPPENRF